MSQRTYHVLQHEALLLAECAFKAYDTKEEPTPPDGYRFVQYWWGRNPTFFGGGDDEKYGVIFQSTSNEGDYIFAFKGTASDYDMFEDARFIFKSDFQYYNGDTAYTGDVKVAYGFNAIYLTPTDNGHGSMQEQLFNFIDSNHINSLRITGHSLGSALAEMFTLDLNHYALVSGRDDFQYLHYNFACPRVGNASFASTYNHLEQGKLPTVRFVNFEDFIPCEPTSYLGYQHGPDYFLFSFDWYVSDVHKIKHPYELTKVRHSMYNYWKVLHHAVFIPNPQYPILLRGYDGHVITCSVPDSSATECPSLV